VSVSLANCRVVLVRTHFPGNLGAAARAMRNFGLTDLALVAPVADPLAPESRRLSTHGDAVLTAARRCADLGEAVADCGLVVATSAATAGLFREHSSGPPEAVLPHLLAALDRGPAALVFGPEPSGLTSAEISRCHFLLHLPAAPDYPSLNLAQAVAISLYELFRLSQKRGTPPAAGEGPAPFAEQERMFAALRQALEEVHFLFGPKADALMHAVRHLIGRAQPTRQEVKLLFGLARQLRWVAARLPSGFSPGGAAVNSQGCQPLDEGPKKDSPGGATGS
jgi:tRNA/rRNA methyltransferase